jgi:hypothetical protein
MSRGNGEAMRRAAKTLKVAHAKRDKAPRFGNDAPNMPWGEDGALLIQYAKFLDEEAANLEARAVAKGRDRRAMQIPIINEMSMRS